jgi:hypothetical protein
MARALLSQWPLLSFRLNSNCQQQTVPTPIVGEQELFMSAWTTYPARLYSFGAGQQSPPRPLSAQFFVADNMVSLEAAIDWAAPNPVVGLFNRCMQASVRQSQAFQEIAARKNTDLIGGVRIQTLQHDGQAATPA